MNKQDLRDIIEEPYLLHKVTITLYAKDMLSVYIIHKDETDFSASNKEWFYWRAGLPVPFFINIDDINHYPTDTIGSFTVSGINKTSEKCLFNESTFKYDIWEMIKNII